MLPCLQFSHSVTLPALVVFSLHLWSSLCLPLFSLIHLRVSSTLQPLFSLIHLRVSWALQPSLEVVAPAFTAQGEIFIKKISNDNQKKVRGQFLS